MGSSGIVERGFTLIELSIVLVIIGLIVGGVLAGQDLIRAAASRAEVSQIERYNTAVNTFIGKYGVVPGDLSSRAAAEFGFAPRGNGPGMGDGNGLIQGMINFTTVCNTCQQGETALFWRDLSAVNLIDGTFTAAVDTGLTTSPVTVSTTPALKDFFPEAKIGQGNFIYVYAQNGQDFYGISSIAALNTCASINSNPTLTVLQARAIDTKIDDGLPQTGNVQALYLSSLYNGCSDPPPVWAAGGGNSGTSDTYATPSSSTSCYDNGSVSGTQQTYSVEFSNGANANCALSFRFQ